MWGMIPTFGSIQKTVKKMKVGARWEGVQNHFECFQFQARRRRLSFGRDPFSRMKTANTARYQTPESRELSVGSAAVPPLCDPVKQTAYK